MTILSEVRAAFEARQNAVNELHTLAESAENREFTAEETATEERLNGAIDTQDARIRQGMERLESERSTSEAHTRLIEMFAGQEGNSPAPPGGQRSDADRLRQLIRGEIRSADFAPASPEAWALAKAGAAGEANVIPVTVHETLFEVVREYTTIIAAGATVWRTASGERITQPKVAGYSTAAIIGESQPIPYSDPSFAPHFTIDAYKYGFMSKMSNELVADAFFDIVGFLSRQGGQSLAAGIGAHLLAGTGTNQPNGALNNTVGKTLAGAAISGDDLIDIYHSIQSVYRSRSVWVFNDLTVAAARKLKDSTGQYLWQSGLVGGAPDTILGRPVYTDVGIPTLAAASKVGLFGDLSAGYVVRFAGPLRIERSDEYAFNTDEIAFRFLQRADGEIMNNLAFKVIAVT